MYDVILTRLSSQHRNLRTDEVRGRAEELPRKGERFVLVGPPLTEGAPFRAVTTSEIQEVRHHSEEGSLEFWTENSHYGLQILDMRTQGGSH